MYNFTGHVWCNLAVGRIPRQYRGTPEVTLPKTDRFAQFRPPGRRSESGFAWVGPRYKICRSTRGTEPRGLNFGYCSVPSYLRQIMVPGDMVRYRRTD